MANISPVVIGLRRKSMSGEKLCGTLQSVGCLTVTKVKTSVARRNPERRAITHRPDITSDPCHTG